jgi:NAD(P)-dependent dehydrogenase (short-subunit alcohol dehydrogenase family)
MASEFKGKVALVTGGGSGIGEACANRLPRVVAASWWSIATGPVQSGWPRRSRAGWESCRLRR